MCFAKRALPLIGAILLFNGCVLFQSNESFHYLMESDVPVAVRQETPIVPETVAVAEPSVVSIYERRQIVQRTSGPQLRLLTNDLWAQPPSEGVQGVVAERLKLWGGFTDVVPEDRRSDARYLLTTSIDRLEFDVSASEPAADVDILFILLDTNDGTPVPFVQYRHEERRVLPTDTPLDYVVATNAMIATGIDQMCLAIKDAMR